jgi:rhomboid protease GluP
MCPNCRAFITVDDRVCPYCDFKLGSRAVDRRSPGEIAGGMISHARFTTVVLLLINAGLYVVTAVYSMKASGGEGALDIDPRTLYIFGAKFQPNILAGQWWRLITAGFLHGGILHILMNSWVIFDLGATVEEFFGTARYLVIYFCATVLGFLASTLWSPSLSVGASAGLFGLIGAMIALGVRSNTTMGSALRAHYTQWAIWGVVMGLLPGFRVDNAAHLGGLAAGFLMGYIAGTPRLVDTWSEKFWRIAAACCLVITAAAFVQMILSFLRASANVNAF